MNVTVCHRGLGRDLKDHPPSPPLPYHEQGCHLLSQALAQVAQGPSYPLRVGKNRHRASFCYFSKVSWFLGTQDHTSLIMT